MRQSKSGERTSLLKPFLFLMLFILLSISVAAQTYFMGFEAGNSTSHTWTSDTPNDQWNVSAYEPYAGSYCLISGGMAHNSTSNINLNVNIISSGSISFAMRTDTEYGGGQFGDFLRFYIDGVLQAQWAGINPWSVQSFSISAGVHNLSWSFHRDAFDMDEGVHEMDRVFIDSISLPSCFFYPGAGFGSAADPYQITNAAQLNSLRNYLGSSYANVHFKQMNDISLASYLLPGGDGYTAWGGSGWLPFGSATSQYYGHFNGNYKSITGLKIARSSQEDCGLWSNTATGSLIENLNVFTEESATVQGANSTGMLVGKNSGTITNCSATGNVSGATWVGGIVGWNYGNLYRCHTHGSVIGGGNTVGGVIGQNNGFIYDSYSSASARGVNYVGGVVGYQGTGGSAGITNCYATGYISNTGSQIYKGGVLGFLNSGSASNSYWDVQTTGMSTSYGLSNSYGKTTSAMKIQATFAGWDFAGETTNGSNDYWYLNPSYNNGYPYLVWEQVATANPVLPRISVNATQIGFGDVYLGNTQTQSFAISNIGQLPLSGSISIPNGYTVNGQSGSLALNLPAGSTLDCTLIFAPMGYGNFDGTVIITSNSDAQSTFNLTVTGVCIPVPEYFAGGSGTEADPWLISTPGQLSLLNNYLGTEHSDKYFKITTDMDMSSYFAEGSAGYNYGWCWTPIGDSNDLFYGKVDGNYRSLTGFKALHANHSGGESWIGLFGNTSAGFRLKNLNLGISFVTGYNQIGGMVGVNYGEISNCHVTASGGIFSLFGVYCGGFAGMNYGSISKCSFKGAVQGTLKVGGFAGVGFGSISDCFTTGSVVGYERVGGFSGTSGAHFSNCYASVTMDYSANSTPIAGGFSGDNPGTSISYSNCYWNRELSNTPASSGLDASCGKTTAQMKTASTFVGFDMLTVWQQSAELNDGYPFIRPAPPTAVTNVTAITRSVLIGSQTSDVLRLSNTGGSDLAYSISVEYPARSRTAENWLTLDAVSTITDTLIFGSARQFSVGLDATQLPAGTYHANISIVSNAPANSPLIIPVTLDVGYGENPYLVVSPDTLSFGAMVVNNSSSLDFNITNAGNTILTGSFTPPLGYTLSYGSANFSIGSGATLSCTMTFTPTTPGVYNTEMLIHSNSLLHDDYPMHLCGEGYIPPSILVQEPGITATLPIDGQGTETLSIGNSGSRPLNYTLEILSPERREYLTAHRNINGSTLIANTSQYAANSTVDWVFTVYNASTDYEWLKNISISFPAGVVVNSVSNFEGGTGGALVPNTNSGNGISVLWSGSDGGWGVIRGGESAVATINVSIQGDFVGSLNLAYQIDGDIYGAMPHSLNGNIALEPASLSLDWLSVSPISGSVSGGASRLASLQFDAAAMLPGLYSAILRINSNDPVNPVYDIPVQMQISSSDKPVLSLLRDGTDILLSWTDVYGATSYRVYRSLDPMGEFNLLAETESLSYLDTANEAKAFYQVRAVFATQE